MVGDIVRAHFLDPKELDFGRIAQEIKVEYFEFLPQ